MTQARSRYALFVLAFLAASTPAFAEQAKFQYTGVGGSHPGELRGVAYGVSDNGVVVGDRKPGTLDGPQGDVRPYRWRTQQGISIGDLGMLDGVGSVTEASAKGVSGDGSVVVGYSVNGVRRAFVWKSSTNMRSLEPFAVDDGIASEADAVSYDGTTIVGYTQRWGGVDRAFRWSSTAGFENLGDLGGGTSRARGVSGDGSVIVGESAIDVEGTLRAFRWNAATGVIDDLGTIDDAPGESVAQGVSTDGAYVVGESDTLEGRRRAFVYTDVGGMQELPTIGDYPGDSVAYSVSADGRTIAGVSASEVRPDGEACVWFDGVPVSFESMVDDRYGLQTSAWWDHFRQVRCSPDGLHFAAEGYYVSDSTSPHAGSRYAMCCVTVAPDLQRPVVESDVPHGSTITLRANQTFRATITAFDPDVDGSIRMNSHGGPTNRISSPPLGTKVEGSGPLVCQVEWTPTGAYNLTYDISFGFTDKFGTFIEWRVHLFVPPNATPEVAPIEPVVAECVDGAHNVTLSTVVTDLDSNLMLVKWLVNGEEIVVQDDVPSGSTLAFKHDYPHGVHNVEFRAWDRWAPPTIVRTTVTVEDTTAPILIVAPDITVGTDAGKDFASNVVLTPPTAYDGSGHEITLTSDAPATYPLGTTEVVWTAEDEEGNAAQGVQKVIVEDQEAPTLVGSASAEFFVDPGKIFSTATLPLPEATDNVDDSSAIQIVTDAPLRFPIGTTQVTFTASDGRGNSATWPMDVTVVNRQPRAIAGTNVVVTTTSEKGLRVSLDGSASSDPDSQRLKLSWSAPDATLAGAKSATPSGLFPVGRTFATLTAIDPAGASDTDRVRVVVKLKNGKPRPSGAQANESFGRAVAQAKQAATGGRSGASSLLGLAYANAASGLGDATGEFVRWEEGRSEDDAFLAYAELRLLQQAYGEGATSDLLAAYAETGDESLLAAAMNAALGVGYAGADLNER